jgi:hypothetical protein
VPALPRTAFHHNRRKSPICKLSKAAELVSNLSPQFVRSYVSSCNSQRPCITPCAELVFVIVAGLGRPFFRCEVCSCPPVEDARIGPEGFSPRQSRTLYFQKGGEGNFDMMSRGGEEGQGTNPVANGCSPWPALVRYSPTTVHLSVEA